MTEEASKPTSSREVLSMPLAIIVAGGLIALAIYFGMSGRAGIGSVGNQQVAETADQPAAPAGDPLEPPVGTFREVTSDDHIRGPADAKITIIEYSDLECPFCKRFHSTMQQAIAEYPNDVRWVYRHFPLEQLHQKAPAEANASECAAEQGKFWEFVDLIFETTQGNDSLDLSTLPQLAQQAGVQNVSQFQSCVDINKYKDKVDADLADAAAAGGRGTPYSVVIGPDGQKQPINGAQPYATVKATIDSLL
jgi:protein-disulfide isomerase